MIVMCPRYARFLFAERVGRITPTGNLNLLVRWSLLVARSKYLSIVLFFYDWS